MQGVAVAVIDLAGRQRRADRRQFVAGREEGDAQPAPDRHLDDAERGDQPQFGRTDALAGGQRNGAARQVLAGAPGVLAFFLAGGNDDGAVLDARHLLYHHGIRPGRQDSAGHDAHRLPLADQPGEGVAGEGAADHLQARFAVAGEAVAADRVAVHRRVVVRRHVVRGDDVGGEDAAERAAQRHELAASDWRHLRQQMGARLVGGESAVFGGIRGAGGDIGHGVTV